MTGATGGESTRATATSTLGRYARCTAARSDSKRSTAEQRHGRAMARCSGNNSQQTARSRTNTTHDTTDTTTPPATSTTNTHHSTMRGGVSSSLVKTAGLLMLVMLLAAHLPQATQARTERNSDTNDDDSSMIATRQEMRALHDLLASDPDIQALVLRKLIGRRLEDDDVIDKRDKSKRRPGCVSGCLSQGGMSFVRCKSLCR